MRDSGGITYDLRILFIHFLVLKIVKIMETGFHLLGNFQDRSGFTQSTLGQPLTTDVVSLMGDTQEVQSYKMKVHQTGWANPHPHESGRERMGH